jgi:ribonuclease HI
MVLLFSYKHQITIMKNTNSFSFIELTITSNELKVEFYMDGSYNPITNHAAYAAVRGDNFNKTAQGHIPGVQNSYRAELFGILLALYNINNKQDVIINTDSQFSINVITSFMKTKISEQLLNYLNKDLLFTIYNKLLHVGEYKFVWVPSHVGIEGNEKANQKAKHAFNYKTIKFIPT